MCLTLRAAFALQIGFPANLSMQYRYNLNRTTALLSDARNSAPYTYPYRTKKNGEPSEKHNGNREYQLN